jgi:septal ring factor EnvC (AmiA/AmiB activator)
VRGRARPTSIPESAARSRPQRHRDQVGTTNENQRPPLSPNEIAIYAVENRAIIQILWGLLLIMSITLVAVSIMYVLLRLQMRSNRRREAQLARNVAAKSEEIARLEAKIAELVELEEGVEELKAEVRRADAIRTKSERRLQQQNTELDALRTVAAERMSELERLRKIVEHVDGL